MNGKNICKPENCGTCCVKDLCDIQRGVEERTNPDKVKKNQRNLKRWVKAYKKLERESKEIDPENYSARQENAVKRIKALKLIRKYYSRLGYDTDLMIDYLKNAGE